MKTTTLLIPHELNERDLALALEREFDATWFPEYHRWSVAIDNAIVYIDADHSYDGVISDLKDWTPFVKSGGLIIGDDYGVPEIPGVTKAVDIWFNAINAKCRLWWATK